MKRLMSMVLCILSIASAAFADQVTLTELRTQTPEFLELELPGKDGVPVATRIPVTIPDTDGLHVQLMRPMVLDKTALFKKYTPLEKIAPEPDGHHEYFCFERFAPKGKTKIFSYREAGCNLYRDQQPDNNDMPWDRPAEKLQEIIEMCGWDADVRVTWQAATSEGYAAKVKLARSIRKEPYAITVFDERSPVKGYEKGYYQLQMAQYLTGVRILGSGLDGGYTFADTKREPEDGYYSWGQVMRMNVLSEENFEILFQLLEPERIISKNVQLAPFDVIRESIENRIGEGKLKTIYGLELGYASLDVLNLADTGMQDAGMRRSLLVPAWCIKGFDIKDDTFRAQNDYTVPTEQEYWESWERYQLWINAVTGEIMWNNMDEVKK